MKARAVVDLKNPWGDGRAADVSDEKCAGRWCLQIAEDKGSYSPGRGYTSYVEKPRLVCMFRHAEGCPIPKPAPEAARLRCCIRPKFAEDRRSKTNPTARPHHKTCQTCGARVPRWVATVLSTKAFVKTLPAASRCPHKAVEHVGEWAGDGRKFWRCADCGAHFEHDPIAHEIGESVETFAARRLEEWKEKHVDPQ